MSDGRSEFRWAVLWWSIVAGILVCAVSYWSTVAALRRAFDVQSFPPTGGGYWLCWIAPLVAVTGTGVGVLLWRWRPAR